MAKSYITCFDDLEASFTSFKSNPKIITFGKNKESASNVAINGDSIYVVDIQEESIKLCTVKRIYSYMDGKHLQMVCCEKGKYRDFIPSGTVTQGNGIYVVFVNKYSSECGLASITLNGAIKILNRYKQKKMFASLGNEDFIYVLNRRTNTIKKIKISDVHAYTDTSTPTFRFTCEGNIEIIMSHSIYNERTSVYTDTRFSIHKLGDYRNEEFSTYSSIVFCSDDKAQSELKKIIREEEKKKQKTEFEDGKCTNLLDSKERDITVGDEIVYVDKYNSLSRAKVIGFTSKSLIKIFDEDNKKWLIEYYKEWDEKKIQRGEQPIERDTSSFGILSIKPKKAIVIKKWNE